MDEYKVRMSECSFRDLDSIYDYIAKTLLESGTALALVDEIESAILSLGTMPHHCPVRKVGAYANRGYRQLFMKNYIVLFRIEEKKKQVIIVTIRYSVSAF